MDVLSRISSLEGPDRLARFLVWISAMSAYEFNRAVPLGAITTFRLTNLVEQGYKAFRAWRLSRATQESLEKLSDRELSDIGLNRGDIAQLADHLARR
jgi:uncharacterized protein YjiS (DUF1127 family)